MSDEKQVAIKKEAGLPSSILFEDEQEKMKRKKIKILKLFTI